MRLPKNPFHPGEMLLEEFLVPGKMTQFALAQKLGWTRAPERTEQGNARHYGRLGARSRAGAADFSEAVDEFAGNLRSRQNCAAQKDCMNRRERGTCRVAESAKGAIHGSIGLGYADGHSPTSPYSLLTKIGERDFRRSKG